MAVCLGCGEKKHPGLCHQEVLKGAKPTPKTPSVAEVERERVETYTHLVFEKRTQEAFEKGTPEQSLIKERRKRGGARPGAGRKRHPLTKAERQKAYRDAKRAVESEAR